MQEPDFATVTSREQAEELFRQDLLERLFLLPVEFGGQDVPENFVYVPTGFVEIKRSLDNNIIKPLMDEGKIRIYQAIPEYQGDSFIPIAITISASGPAKFSSRIDIWGDALGLQPVQ